MVVTVDLWFFLMYGLLCTVLGAIVAIKAHRKGVEDGMKIHHLLKEHERLDDMDTLGNRHGKT